MNVSPNVGRRTVGKSQELLTAHVMRPFLDVNERSGVDPNFPLLKGLATVRELANLFTTLANGGNMLPS